MKSVISPYASLKPYATFKLQGCGPAGNPAAEAHLFRGGRRLSLFQEGMFSWVDL